jgi:hypothetical protein
MKTQNHRPSWRRLLPTPSMAVALLALIVAMSGSAYAAAKINGKNIVKGSITSKQIKDRSIQKNDLSPKIGTIGPAGPAGPAGKNGVSNVVVHRKDAVDVANLGDAATSVTCDAGETLVGGGANWVEKTTNGVFTTGTIKTSGPLTAGKSPVEGGTADGWFAAGTNTTGFTRNLVVYAICTKP